MATSIRAFNVGLYEEHLSEASFLFDQRWAYLHDVEVDWPSLHQWDERLEAQLDALLIGGSAALAVARGRAAEGDAGELHAALRLFCRHDLKADVLQAIAGIDPEKTEAARAAALALRAELPASWRDDIVRALHEQPRAAAVYADVLGFKRVPVEAQLLQTLAALNGHGRAEAAWALGRVGSHASVGPLRRLVNEAADARTQRLGSVALLRLGDDSPAVDAQAAAAGTDLQQEVLGLAGDPSCVPLLLERLREPDKATTAAFALGLLGDLAAVGPLLALLAQEESARAAAVALNTITGAQLHARVFVPYTFDVDELNDEERAAFERDGTVPTRAGEPFGAWERRPLIDQAGWRQWLDQNKHRFQRGLRWRAGLPYGPEALVRCIRNDTTPHAVRTAAYDELVLRYRLDVPFEADLSVPQQRRSIARLEQWVTEQAAAFDAGGWYFAGQRQT